MDNSNSNNNINNLFSYILLLGEFLSRRIAENEQKRKDQAREFKYSADQKNFESNLNKTKKNSVITQGSMALIGIGAIVTIILSGNKQKQKLEARLETLTQSQQNIRNVLDAAQAARQELANSLKNLQDSKQEQAASQTLSPDSRLQSSSNVNIDSGMSSSMVGILNNSITQNNNRIENVQTTISDRISQIDNRIEQLNKRSIDNAIEIAKIIQRLRGSSSSSSVNSRSKVTCRPGSVGSNNHRHDREDDDRRDSDNRGNSSTGREQAGPSIDNTTAVGYVVIPETINIGDNSNTVNLNSFKATSLKEPVLLSAVKPVSLKPAVLEQQYILLKDLNCIGVYNNSIKGSNDNVEPYNYNNLIKAYKPKNPVLKIKHNHYDTVKNHDEFHIYKIEQNSNYENCEIVAKEAALLNKNYIEDYNKYLNEWLDNSLSKLENINQYNTFVKTNSHIKENQLNYTKVIKNPYGFKYNYKSEHPALEVMGLEQEVVFVTLTPTIELVEFCVLNTNNAFYVGLFVPTLGCFYTFQYVVLFGINLLILSLITSSIKELANNMSILIFNKDIKNELNIIIYQFFNLLLLGFIGFSIISLNFPLFMKTSSICFTKNLIGGNIKLNKYYAIKYMDIY